MPVRSVMLRDRPWVCDGVFIAHESLTLFQHFARLMPTRGYWRLGPDGFKKEPRELTLSLVRFMAGIDAASEPCLLDLAPYERFATIEEAADHAGEQVVEAVAGCGTWHFDYDIVAAATVGPRGELDTSAEWSWRLAEHAVVDGESGAVLIGYDHKDRQRFAVMSLTTSGGAR